MIETSVGCHVHDEHYLPDVAGETDDPVADEFVMRELVDGPIDSLHARLAWRNDVSCSY